MLRETMPDRAGPASTAQPSASVPEFSFRGVTRTFPSGDTGEFTALEAVDLDVESGSLVCFIGPSGCGKTTLLNMSAGLLPPSAGTVSFRGTPLSGVNTGVGFMTQHDNLLPWRTVEKNVGIALEIEKVPRAERRRRVAEVLDLVGLAGFADRYPSQLSGGMQKRASLARGLVYDPSTLLMDEPFGALDAQLRLGMQNELLRIWERDRKTIIFVTHDLDEAILLADRIVVFGTRPGRVIHVEDVPLERPRDLTALRLSSEYGEIWERLWRLLDDSKDGEETQ
ncbi:NitT/TauT family transport system ATP-binding protein [Streptomyces sp. BpilaLS-43]|uniref:ABC transporter ATP-binding protein n=1 Tax=Streptomyces sp. BpilaLS-43 TaxID=1839778 RepID=UPI00081B3255|nr:ABC transporter ATP-binding protein [Streptomyces sp. BpilaLS-43]SCD43137.1 NitT/TauT family transport system ATP-binding protein [Streptomyces sp. BpilaLS-43]